MLYGINTLQNEIYEKINASSQFDFFFYRLLVSISPGWTVASNFRAVTSIFSNGRIVSGVNMKTVRY